MTYQDKVNKVTGMVQEALRLHGRRVVASKRLELLIDAAEEDTDLECAVDKAMAILDRLDARLDRLYLAIDALEKELLLLQESFSGAR